MIIQERSYSPGIFRPKPTIIQELDNQLMIIATNWGQPESAQKMISEITKYVSATIGDIEVTTPFQFLPQFSPQVNSLRIASFLANEMIFRTDNKSDYSAGMEVCILLKYKNQLSWLQYGHPNIFLLRGQKTIQPLSINSDISMNFKSQTKPAPLPQFLLGIDPIISPQVGQIQLQSEDQILLLASSEIPACTYSLGSEKKSLSEFVLSLSQENEDMPFWLGLVSPND